MDDFLKPLLLELEGVYKKLDSLLYDYFPHGKEINLCINCFSCCKFPIKLSVSSPEILYIMGKTDDSIEIEPFVDFINQKKALDEPIFEYCPFYDPDLHNCRIYPFRPFCCRVYGYSHNGVLIDGCNFKNITKDIKKWEDIKQCYNMLSNLRLKFYRFAGESFKPITYLDFLCMGINMIEIKKPEIACDLFEKAKDIAPNDPLTNFYLGWSQEIRGNPDEAIIFYHKAINLDENNVDFRIKLGFIYYSLGKYNEALYQYEKIIIIAPDDARGYGNVGMVLQNMQDFQKALVSFKKASEIMPSDIIYRICMAGCYEMLGEPEKAIVEYNTAVEINPLDENIYLCLGRFYEVRSEINNAVSAYEGYLNISNNIDMKNMISRHIADLRNTLDGI